MTTPSGSSAGRSSMRARMSADQHQGRAHQRACRQHDAMVGSRQQPHQVRHDDADEAENARDGNGCADRGRRDQHDRALGALDVDAEMKGLGLAEQQAVEAADQSRQDERDEQRRRV